MKIVIKTIYFIEFILFYLKRLIKSNIAVAYEILTPDFHMKPAIIEVTIGIKNDYEILAMTNLISLTPGTLTLDISDDKKKIYIHSMFVHDVEEFINDIEQLEKNIHKLLA